MSKGLKPDFEDWRFKLEHEDTGRHNRTHRTTRPHTKGTQGLVQGWARIHTKTHGCLQGSGVHDRDEREGQGRDAGEFVHPM